MAEVEQAMEHAAIKVAEHVHEVADHIPEVTQSLLRMKAGFAGIGAAVGVAVGGIVAYRLAEKRWRLKYAKIMDEELTQMREHYAAREVARAEKPDLTQTVVKQEKYVSDDPHVSSIEEAQKRARLKAPVPVNPPPGEPVKSAQTQNVFSGQVDSWDYQAELTKRAANPEAPYIIHVDERGETEGYSQITLTYYAGDDVLCDEEDKPIHDDQGLVTRDALDRFGHGSNDPNVVYVRNDHLDLEMEIIRSPNAYAEEVHGFKHADPPRRRRGPKWDD